MVYNYSEIFTIFGLNRTLYEEFYKENINNVFKAQVFSILKIFGINYDEFIQKRYMHIYNFFHKNSTTLKDLIVQLGYPNPPSSLLNFFNLIKRVAVENQNITVKFLIECVTSSIDFSYDTGSTVLNLLLECSKPVLYMFKDIFDFNRINLTIRVKAFHDFVLKIKDEPSFNLTWSLMGMSIPPEKIANVYKFVLDFYDHKLNLTEMFEYYELNISILKDATQLVIDLFSGNYSIYEVWSKYDDTISSLNVSNPVSQFIKKAYPYVIKALKSISEDSSVKRIISNIDPIIYLISTFPGEINETELQNSKEASMIYNGLLYIISNLSYQVSILEVFPFEENISTEINRSYDGSKHILAIILNISQEEGGFLNTYFEEFYGDIGVVDEMIQTLNQTGIKDFVLNMMFR